MTTNMDDGMHVIDLRMKCVLVVLRFLLVLLLKYSCRKHIDCKKKADLGIGMAEIYKANESNLEKNKKSCYRKWTGTFYDKVVVGTSSGFTLKSNFIVGELDFAVICDLLLEQHFSALDKCCKDCEHKCNNCGGVKCEETVLCNYQICAKCRKKCEFMDHYKSFIIIAKALRNTNAHTTFGGYDNFEKRLCSLRLFPKCSSWKDIWELMNNAAKWCFQKMETVPNPLIDHETYKDKKMELRLGLRKEKDFLIPIVGHYIQEFYRNIVRKEEMSVELQTMHQNIGDVLENVKRLLEDRSIDFVWHENKMINFHEDENQNIPLYLKSNDGEKVILSCKKIADDFKLLCFQAKTSKGWFEFPKDMYKIYKDVDGIQLDVIDLRPRKTYSFRLLGIDVKNKNTYVLTYKKLEMKPIESKQFVEVNGKKIDIVKDERLVLHQKVEDGLIFEPLRRNEETYCTRKEDIIAIQYSRDKQPWIDIREGQYDIHNDGLMELKNLSEIMNCRIRIIWKTSDGWNVQFSMTDVAVKGKLDLHPLSVSHSSKSTILAFFYRYGFPEDLHELVGKSHSIDVTKIKRYQLEGGSISEHLPKGNEFLKNFSDDDMITFHGRKQPTLTPQHQQQSAYFTRVVELFRSFYQRYFRELKVFITGYDMVHHIRSITVPLILNDFDLILSEKLNSHLIIFNSELNTILNVHICGGTTKHDLREAFKNCHDQLKALAIVLNDLVNTGFFVFTGIVVTRHMNKRQLEELQFFRRDIKTTYKLFTIPLTDDDMKNHNEFFEKRLCDITAEIYEFQREFKKVCDQQGKYYFCELPNRLMVMSSMASLEGSTPCRNTHEQILNLLFNKEQVIAMNDPVNRKIIQGPYGSGKTIVCQRILENLLERSRNIENQHFYYLNCDEYSLLQCESKKYCQSLEIKYKTKINCMSIDEISQEKGSSSILSLTQCLDYLVTKHSLEDERVHIFLDEFDSEDLGKEEAVHLNKLLNKNCFLHSIIILNVQSILKVRKNCVGTLFLSKSESPAFMDLEVKVFSLLKTMRCTINVHRIIKVVQAHVSAKENRYYLPQEIGLFQRSRSHHAPKDAVRHHSNDVTTTFDELDAVDAVPQKENPHEEAPKIIQPSFKVDTLAAKNEITPKSELSNRFYINTNFEFSADEGCGHGIEGKIPVLVRLDKRICNTSILPTTLTIDAVASIFNQFLEPKWINTIVIATTLEIAEIAYYALQALKLHVVVYINALKLEYTTKDVKEDVYKRWNGEKNCALLTDYRGCRGLQHGKVAVLLDEDEINEHFILPEIIARATSNITIFSFNRRQETDRSGIIKNILDQLVNENLVDAQNYEHLKFGSFANEFKRYAKKLFERSIDKRKGRELYSQHFPQITTELRDAFIYARARHLATYIINKQFGSAETDDEIGDKLYMLAKLNNKTSLKKAFLDLFKNTNYSGDDCYKIIVKTLEDCSRGRLVAVFCFVMYFHRTMSELNQDLVEQFAKAVSLKSEWIIDHGGLEEIFIDCFRRDAEMGWSNPINWLWFREAFSIGKR